MTGQKVQFGERASPAATYFRSRVCVPGTGAFPLFIFRSCFTRMATVESLKRGLTFNVCNCRPRSMHPTPTTPRVVHFASVHPASCWLLPWEPNFKCGDLRLRPWAMHNRPRPSAAPAAPARPKRTGTTAVCMGAFGISHHLERIGAQGTKPPSSTWPLISREPC